MTVLQQRLLDHLLLELHNPSKELRLKYPGLTTYEIRLCTYLKANLSTKEIATVLNITPDSVKKAKHRLRKKLSLRPVDSFFF